MNTLNLVLLGIVLIAIAPVIQDFIGRTAAGRAMAMGLALNALGALLTPKSEPASVLAVTVLLWALVVFIAFKVRMRMVKAPTPPTAVEHCVSKLTYGQHVRVPSSGLWRDLDSVWSDLRWIFEVTPTDSSLTEYLYANGGDYYVFAYYFYRIEETRVINIACEVERGKCRIHNPVSITGSNKPKDRSLSGGIAEEIEYTNDSVTIIVDMGVALDAAEVSLNLKASKKGVGGSANVKFVKASKESGDTAMGSYTWKCAVPETALVPPPHNAPKPPKPGHHGGSGHHHPPGGGEGMGGSSHGHRPTEDEDDEPDCGFQQEFALVASDGPEDGSIKFSYTVTCSGDVRDQGDETAELDEDGHVKEDWTFDTIVVRDECTGEFAYKCDFEFDVLDKDGNSVGTGTASVDTFVKDCKIDGEDDATLDFDVEIAGCKIDGFVRIIDLMCC